MDFHSQFGNMDGDFSILGSKKTGAPPQSTRAVEGANIVWDKKRGSVMTKEGAVFPGLVDNDDDTKGFIHQHSLTVTVPDDVIGQHIVVSGVVSIEATSGSAAIYADMLCVETGATISNRLVVVCPAINDNVTIISGSLNGAGTAGNTIKITLRRQANEGSDTTGSQFDSVILHSVDAKFVRGAIKGRSDSYRFLGLKSGGIRNL